MTVPDNPDDDLDLLQWGAKHYGVTPFGTAWPKGTIWGDFLTLHIAVLRLYVKAVYLPIIRPLLRWRRPA